MIEKKLGVTNGETTKGETDEKSEIVISDVLHFKGL